MNERLLRGFIKKTLLYEASLTKSEMGKYDWRWDTFLKKITGKSPVPFKIDPKNQEKYGGVSSVIIPRAGNAPLMTALEAKDAAAYGDAFKRYKDDDGKVHGGVRAYADGEPIVITAAGHLYKDGDFGGRGGIPLSIQNEIDFANAVNWAYSASEVPITVQVGNHQVHNVVGADQAGQLKVEVGTAFDKDGNEIKLKETSKADVNLVLADNTLYPVSIKMKSAEYWLSGDAKLKDVIAPILQGLELQVAPHPRLILEPDGNYQMVQGPDENPVGINVKFELPPAVAEEAVFGTDKNPVGIIAKGDFISDPIWDGENSVLKWGKGVTYRREDGVDKLPDHEKPVGLLRKGEKKSGGSVRRGTAGYPGIRPAVASAKRTARAVSVDPSALATSPPPGPPAGPPDSPELDVAHRVYGLRLLIREALLTEELTKSDKAEIKKMAKKQAKSYFDSEIDKALGVSFFGNKGKVNKFVDDEIDKRFKSGDKDKDFSNAVEKVAKRVIQALFDMHYKRNNLVKNMPVPKG